MPPSSDDLPGRRMPRKQRRAAERAQKKKRGKQPGNPGASMTWEVPDRAEEHYPQGACSCGLDLADAQDLGVARSFQQEELPAAAAKRVQHDLHKVRCACGRPHVAAPCGRAGLCPVHRSQAAGPGRLPGGLPARPGGAVPAADRRRHRRAVSDGFIHSCLAKAASLAAEVVGLIRALITAAPVAGFDETTLRSGPAGGKKYVHGAFTGEYSAFWLGARSLTRCRTPGSSRTLPGSWSPTGTRTTSTPGESTSRETRRVSLTSCGTTRTAPRATRARSGRCRRSGRCAA
jgi:transposase